MPITWTERFFDPRIIHHPWRITAVICLVRYKRLVQKSVSLDSRGASGMFKSFVASTSASFSSSNIAQLTQNISPRKSSVQDGMPICGESDSNVDDVDTDAIEAALMDASLDEDLNQDRNSADPTGSRNGNAKNKTSTN